MFSVPPFSPVSLFWRQRSAAGDQSGSWTWETRPAAKPLSTEASLIPYISQNQQWWDGVCPPSGVTGDDGLPRGEERRGEEAALLPTLRTS
ncbi:hypothetical protein PAMP_013556 [Pampus punctatissimus]